jgi:CTD kinase subunit beta
VGAGQGTLKRFPLTKSCDLSADKDYIKRAFRLAIDAHRTVLPLSYPPHTIAAACLYLTSFLTTDADDASVPSFDQGWAERIQCLQDDIEGILCIC